MDALGSTAKCQTEYDNSGYFGSASARSNLDEAKKALADLQP